MGTGMDMHAGACWLEAALEKDPNIAVILADRNGCVRFWNAGAAALFGHGMSEALGRRVDLIVPHEYRAMHWAGFDRTIGSGWAGHDSWGPIDALHRSGATVAVEVLLTPVRDGDGRVTQILAMFRRRPS